MHDPAPDVPVYTVKPESEKESQHDAALTPSEIEIGSGSAPPLNSTQRGLKSRHAQMMAFGGTVGTGFFVNIGQALAIGGPGFLLLAYGLISIFVYGIVTATSEISAYLPTHGSNMASYGTRYVSRSLGFAMGWLYWYSFAILVPYEITAGGLVIDYWPNSVPIGVWITIFFVVIVALNCCPVKVYGETEFWFSSLKVFLILGLLILSFILFWGGGPTHDRLGFRYWQHPGAVNEYLVSGGTGRLVAFIYTSILSMFSFNFAPELLVIAGGEMKSPRRNLPRAAKQYFYRLLVFYILGSIAVGVIVPSDADGLMDGGSGAGSSPWVIGAKRAGIRGLDSVINAVIITSAWSAGNSYLYMSSRSLYSLALAGNAPRVFTRCNRWGLPWAALAASSTLTLLAYLNVGESAASVFNWFINITNCASFISWICCCLIFFRFRAACATQNITDLPFKSPLQPYLAYASITAFSILLLLNGFTCFIDGHWSTSKFLTSYIGLPIFLAIYAGHRICHRGDAWATSAGDVDMVTGLEEVYATEEPEKASGERWYSGLKSVFG